MPRQRTRVIRQLTGSITTYAGIDIVNEDVRYLHMPRMLRELRTAQDAIVRATVGQPMTTRVWTTRDDDGRRVCVIETGAVASVVAFSHDGHTRPPVGRRLRAAHDTQGAHAMHVLVGCITLYHGTTPIKRTTRYLGIPRMLRAVREVHEDVMRDIFGRPVDTQIWTQRDGAGRRLFALSTAGLSTVVVFARADDFVPEHRYPPADDGSPTTYQA